MPTGLFRGVLPAPKPVKSRHSSILRWRVHLLYCLFLQLHCPGHHYCCPGRLQCVPSWCPCSPCFIPSFKQRDASIAGFKPPSGAQASAENSLHVEPHPLMPSESLIDVFFPKDPACSLRILSTGPGAAVMRHRQSGVWTLPL